MSKYVLEGSAWRGRLKWVITMNNEEFVSIIPIIIILKNSILLHDYVLYWEVSPEIEVGNQQSRVCGAVIISIIMVETFG